LQEILTPRLSLRLMTEDFLEASLNEDAEKTESLVGLKITQDWLDEKDLAQLRLDNYRADKQYIPWGLRAVGLKESNEMIGFIGFHTRPDAEYLRRFSPNAIEFGYTIFLPFRRQGFAQEAVGGLLNWAVTQHPLENFIASVSPRNLASTALIKKLGFEKIGEQIDEFDGLEFVYSLAPDKLKTF
jgi:RimJ/RimL family protein N-acetyltransferase